MLICHSDVFYLLSIGLAHTAGARLGQAVNLAYSMGLHSDEKTESLGLDPIEVQLRRRVFWQMYASDKYVSRYAPQADGIKDSCNTWATNAS